MPIVKCKICKSGFYAKPHWLRKGWGKYCSPKCQYEAQKNGKVVNCFICKREVYRPQQDLKNSKSKKYFCTKSCQTIWRNSMVYIGSKHPNWKDGASTYRDALLRSEVTQVCKMCKTRDQRLLAAHHLDHNKKNNSLDNLMWLCHNCHFLTHHYIDEREKLLELVA